MSPDALAQSLTDAKALELRDYSETQGYAYEGESEIEPARNESNCTLF